MRYPEGVFTGHLFEGMRGLADSPALIANPSMTIAQQFHPTTLPALPALPGMDPGGPLPNQGLLPTAPVPFMQRKLGPLPMWSVVGGGTVLVAVAGFFAWKKFRKPKTTLNGRRIR